MLRAKSHAHKEKIVYIKKQGIDSKLTTEEVVSMSRQTLFRLHTNIQQLHKRAASVEDGRKRKLRCSRENSPYLSRLTRGQAPKHGSGRFSTLDSPGQRRRDNAAR